jgi:hypothetical protein
LSFWDFGKGKLENFSVMSRTTLTIKLLVTEFQDGNIRVGVRATKDFVRIANSWSYEDGVNDLHDEYHKYHLRNYIPRVVGEYRKILSSPKLAAYTRCIPVDCY